MNFRFQPLLQGILVIVSAISFSPTLKAQDVTNLKPTATPVEAIPRTGVNIPDGLNGQAGEAQPIQESNTPVPATPEEKIPPAAQPIVPKPTAPVNQLEIKAPGTSELTPLEGGTAPNQRSAPVPPSQPTSPTSLERETVPIRPSSPVPQSQPTSPKQ